MRIKLGMIVSDASGKLGGHSVYSGGPGAFLRTRNIPRNPLSTSQAHVRNRQQLITSSWKNLTASQRQAWDSAVDRFKSTNVFGDVRRPSGFELYCRLNQNLLEIDRPMISLPGSSEIFRPIEVQSVVVRVVPLACRFGFAGRGNLNWVRMCYISGPLSPGISSKRPFVKFVGYAFADSGSDFVFVQDAYVNRFGLPVNGAKIYWETFTRNRLNGLDSVHLSGFTTVL